MNFDKQQQEGGRLRTRLIQCLETFWYRHDWLYNFRGPMQNENSGPFVQTLKISRQRQQGIKASTGTFYHEALCDCTGQTNEVGPEGSSCSRDWAIQRATLLTSLGS